MTASRSQALDAEVEALARRLRLPYLRKAAVDVLPTAKAQRWDRAEVACQLHRIIAHVSPPGCEWGPGARWSPPAGDQRLPHVGGIGPPGGTSVAVVADVDQFGDVQERPR